MKRLALLCTAVLVFAGCEEAIGPEGESPSAAMSVAAATGTDVIVVLDRDFAPGEHASNESAAAEIARDLGVSPVHLYGTALFGFSAAVPENRLGALERDPRVAYLDRDAPVAIPDPVAAPPCGVMEPCEDDGGGGQTLPWGINRTDADANANTANGIHVYVIDTGIDSDHDDLQANLGNGFAAVSCRGGSCIESWDDDHGHGTHVSGTVGAIDNDLDVVGVAPEVTLHAVKVLSNAGSGTRSDVIEGVDWVASETESRGAASVANMSLGGSGSKSGECTDSGFTGSDSYHHAICNARHVGAVFAVAAGNDGADAEESVPAAYDDAVITASATQCDVETSSGTQSCVDGSDDWPSWSNWGDNAADWTPHGSAPVAIAAPGVDVLSTAAGGGTTTFSGTSMASPHVAGAAALYLSSNAQSADGTAFTNTRSGLMSADESTDGFDNTSGNVHDEDFLDAESL